MRRALAGSVVAMSVLVACGGEGVDDGGADEPVGEVSLPLAAHCSVNVVGKGTKDVESDYLPHVVHCENGGAPFEALKAQAIAARTYLYYKLKKGTSITDGQGDQVYSCGSGPTAAQIKAVKDTAGQVLQYQGTTIAGFFVAGAQQKPPSCKGSTAAATEKYVTYNDGLTGSKVHQTSLGWISPTNKENRGCMSQWGARCLDSAGRTSTSILKFYYGADISIVTATGSCVGGDADGDGKGDASDNCPSVANASQLDTDKDKKGDACDDDDDGDGDKDSADNCSLVKNPDQADLDKDKKGDACDGDDDGDGVADAADNCPRASNKSQLDTDKDKKGDACDDDDDGDGVPDATDVCPKVPDADQLDSDKDEKGDACDDDDDGDGAPDATDNCPTVPNADQLDDNDDGVGDACQEDTDGDGEPDVTDNCVKVENPDQTDADGDGKGDACDAPPEAKPPIDDDRDPAGGQGVVVTVVPNETEASGGCAVARGRGAWGALSFAALAWLAARRRQRA